MNILPLTRGTCFSKWFSSNVNEFDTQAVFVASQNNTKPDVNGDVIGRGIQRWLELMHCTIVNLVPLAKERNELQFTKYLNNTYREKYESRDQEWKACAKQQNNDTKNE